MFILLHSRMRNPELWVRALEGWHQIENGWRWTAKHFALEVALPLELAAEFALRFTVPELVLAAATPIRLRCRHAGELLGAISCDTAETLEFRGRFPQGLTPGAVLRLDFEVESDFAPPGDARELGVIVPVVESRNTEGIPFRIS